MAFTWVAPDRDEIPSAPLTAIAPRPPVERQPLTSVAPLPTWRTSRCTAYVRMRKYISHAARPRGALKRGGHNGPSTGPPPHRRPSRGPPMPTCFLLFLNNGHQSHNLVPIGGLVAFDHRSGSFCFLRPEFLRGRGPVDHQR